MSESARHEPWLGCWQELSKEITEYGMWTLDGARIIGPSVKHLLVAHSFWSLPFPPLPLLPQARQT